MAQSVKDRVYAAAERISAERRPTVSTVRAAAGVSNADATRYLKEWSEERSRRGRGARRDPGRAAGARRTPGRGLLGRGLGAGGCTPRRRRDRLGRRRDKDLTVEVAELVADLDRLTRGQGRGRRRAHRTGPGPRDAVERSDGGVGGLPGRGAGRRNRGRDGGDPARRRGGARDGAAGSVRGFAGPDQPVPGLRRPRPRRRSRSGTGHCRVSAGL